MTLHVSAILRDAVFQVSDRRVTTRAGKVWEDVANKNIVLRTTDALVSIGFSQRAYMGSKPIDEWAADALWGGEIDREALFQTRTPPVPRGLSRGLRRLVDGLNRHFSVSRPAPSAGRVHAVVVGWWYRGRRLRPCLLVISNLATGGLVTVRAHVRNRQRHGIVMVDPPGWVALDRLHQLNDALAQVIAHEAREDLMIDLLRELSHGGAPIADAMCVRIPEQEPKPIIRFAPERLPARVFMNEADGRTEVMPVAYTPIIITPRVAQPPGADYRSAV